MESFSVASRVELEVYCPVWNSCRVSCSDGSQQMPRKYGVQAYVLESLLEG
jgi:hypothetical protein